MPKIWTHADACQVAGELYGRILGRDADKDGFEFAVDRLMTGTFTPRDLVRHMCMSEEFREKFLMNQTMNEFARLVLIRLNGDRGASPPSIKALAVAFLEKDWRVVLRSVIDGNGYTRCYSDDGVPQWVPDRSSDARQTRRRG